MKSEMKSQVNFAQRRDFLILCIVFYKEFGEQDKSINALFGFLKQFKKY